MNDDLINFPYEVYHPEAEPEHGPCPIFATWKEALAAQVCWNKDFPGHRARKRMA